MSVYHHDREPQGNRLSESPRRTRRRPWRERPPTSHRPRLELLEPRVVLSPTIFTVDSTGSGTSGSGTSGTLPYIISQANANPNTDGSEIEFDPSVFSTPQTITLGATLVLSETTGPEVIDGPGAGLVTVSGNNTSEVFNIAGDTVVSMSGLSIIDGNGTFGGGLFNEGTLTITNTTFTGNSALYGGAIYTRNGFLTLTGDTFSSNSATAESGAIDNWAGGTVTVTDDTFTGNSAPYGGAIGNEWGSVAVSNSTFSNNTASTGAGGAIINYNPSDAFSNSLSVVGSTISGNAAVNGGGIANGGPDTLSLTKDTITGNSVTGAGGGLYDNGTSTLTKCTVSGNSAFEGGGLYNISSGTGTMTLADCTISGNAAGGNGGGGENDGTATMAFTDCTLSDNSAGCGGGLWNGGGTATLTLTACTISGNSASGNPAFSGGLYNTASPTATLNTATLTDTIVAGNTGSTGGPSDIGGVQASQVTGSSNLIGTGGSGGIAGGSDGNIVLTSLTDLGLAPLGDYGGRTETMALLPGSAAIGAGTTASGITTDQRGASRPTSGPADIGAFQDQGYTVAVSSGSPQSTLVSQPFNASLVALLTEDFANAPLPGATIGFSAPSSGASATLSADSAVTDTSGLASVSATANATAGTYAVTASATGVTPSASYNLTNQIQPSFSGLTGQTITYGRTVTFTGTLAAGLQFPAGEEVAVTIDGVTHDATIASDGSFSTEFTSADVVLNASSTAYNVAYDYATNGLFLAADGSSQLTVNPAPLTIMAVSDTKVYDGSTASSKTPTYGTLYNRDTVTGLTQAFTSKNVLGANGSTLTVTGYTVNDGDGGKDYTVTTQDASGTISPAALTITATSDTKVYDGTTNSSQTPTHGTLYNGDTVTGLTQAFTSKNVLGTDGSTLSVTGYTVNDGDGGKDYTVTTQDASGTISAAALTITATSDTKVYDDTTSSSQTPTHGTLYDGDTVTGLTQAFTAKNALGANVSTLSVTGYTVNDGDGGKDYTVTTQAATGTITPDPLTVRAKSVSTVYGSPLPTLTYTIAGFVGGDSSSVVSGAPVIATTAASGANAGAYPITIAAGTLSATNYNFPAADLIAGTLTVTPAPLVITAVSTSMFTGQAVPALTAAYTGFVNGDTPASLTPPPVLHSAASPSSAPGNYTITVGGASSPNYTITYVPGTLTVILAPATVESVSIQKIKLSKHKTVQGIVLQFSEALDSATAQSISSYTLATVPKNKKQKSKPVRLSGASYSSSAFTVTLLTRKTLALKPRLELTVKAASLLDALGRELDGNDSGQSGANFTAVLSKAGTSVTSARPLARIGLSSHAVDAVLEAGLRGGR
ncbi:MAG: beta strand repeat-containing protein [Isosphaerales bacterium]